MTRSVGRPKPTLKKDYIFGKTFTDHMLEIDHSKQTGWSKPRIVPYGPITIATSATVLHYGISVHEGISIVENPRKGTLQAFRAKEHLDCFLDSSVHLDMPSFDTDELMGCIKQLVSLDKEWIDAVEELDQFYTRMVHFSTD